MNNTTTKSSPGPDGAYHHLKGNIKEGIENAEGLVSQASEKVEKLVSNIEGSASSYLKSGRDFVKDKPIKSLAYVALGGALAGCVLTLLAGRKK
jgi:ElaB/YqjD/DUF883 family membrane-anchored ribosome-binding protein